MPWVAAAAAWGYTDEESAEALIRQPFRQQLDAKLYIRRIESTPLPLRTEDKVGALRRRLETKLQVIVQAVGNFHHGAESRGNLIVLDLLNRAGGDRDLLAQLPQ